MNSPDVPTVTMRRPDDFHIHLRDDALLKAVLPYTTRHFARGIVMPNLVPPLTSCGAAKDYRGRILAALPKGHAFTPLMTCYLTDVTDPAELEEGYREGTWFAAKLFPAGATTNSHFGVRDIPGLARVFDRMERIGMPLLVHGESVDEAVDIFDREAVFLEKTLLPLLRRHQGLKVVVEHMTTSIAVDLVRSLAPRIAGTITPHHLILTRSMIFQDGLNPYLYCLPVAKTESDRAALRKAATSGDSCFFLGTDSAPQFVRAKQTLHAKAGMFVAPTALQTYAQVFEEEGKLDRLEAFASAFGAAYYGLPMNSGTITLEKTPCAVPEEISVGRDKVRIFRAGETLAWSVRPQSRAVGGVTEKSKQTRGRSAASPCHRARACTPVAVGYA